MQGQVRLAFPPLAQHRPVMDRFVCVLADTPEARRHHHALRYLVFCEETGFEDPDAFPDNAESDHYDAHARHFLVWDRYRQRWAGAMRLVDASSVRLPSEEIADAPLEGLDELRSKSVEFSRLCIHSEYRRISQATFAGLHRPEDGSHPQGLPVLFRQEDDDVLLRLLRASFGWRPDVEHCYFIVTRALSRVLARFGIPLVRVGPAVTHRGWRIPYRYDVRQAEEGMIETLAGFANITESSRPYISHLDLINGSEAGAAQSGSWSLGRDCRRPRGPLGGAMVRDCPAVLMGLGGWCLSEIFTLVPATLGFTPALAEMFPV